jgi:hypothetical protein
MTTITWIANNPKNHNSFLREEKRKVAMRVTKKRIKWGKELLI